MILKMDKYKLLFLKTVCVLSVFIFCDSKVNSSLIQATDKNNSSELIINTEKFAFPDGKFKCLIMSFDDGPEQDIKLLEKLNKADIVGTFHLNSGRIGKKAEWLSSELKYNVHFVDETQVQTIYKGHEISAHGFMHKGLKTDKDSLIQSEVSFDVSKLSDIIKSTNHTKVEGLAYPFGAYNETTLKVLKSLNIKYARTVKSTFNYEIQTNNFLEFHPTVHIPESVDYANYFINSNPKKMRVLNIWGHSYEFHNNWKLADSLCTILGNKKDIWYAKTIEYVNYINTIKSLKYAENKVYNPSKNISVWVKNVQGKFSELHPKKSMKVNFDSSFITVNPIKKLYPNKNVNVAYHGNWSKVHYKQRIKTFKKSPLDFEDVVFLGNSITEQGYDWGKKLKLKNVKNRGIAGDVTDGVLKRLDEITYYKPKTIFLLIGINDLFNLHFVKDISSEEYVAQNIIKICEEIHQKSPETKIYLQTILPTSQEYMVDKINKVNTLLKANKNNSIFELIDLHKSFTNDKGLLKENLTTDGTHLNEKGYKVWTNTIQKHYNE